MSTPDDAALIAALFSVDPVGAGGVCIRSPAHPARDQWLQMLRDLLPMDTPLRRIPFNISDGRLLGDLDLAATIRAKRPVCERGVLAATDRGVVVLSMAERLTAHTAACLAAVLDAGEVISAREGVLLRDRARIGIVALDEGISEDEFVPSSLFDRLAFLLDFNDLSATALLVPEHDREQILAARGRLPQVHCDSRNLTSLCNTAIALGAGSPRVSLLALRVARAAAALDARVEVRDEDIVMAGRLVLAPRATIPPAPVSQNPSEHQSSDQSEDRSDCPQEGDRRESRKNSAEVELHDIQNLLLAATQAAIPSGLLARLRSSAGNRFARSGGAGRAGALRSSQSRGRPCGVRGGSPRSGARVNVIETLRSAAPWQELRGRNRQHDSRIVVRPEDFRVTRYRQRTQTLTIFVLDASGSSALHRLAEAKGAVELLLADCYIRRDQVAVIAFRGRMAELILPPTRSLVRAKRSLAELAGGGGTPLAAAIGTATKLADQAQRRGQTPTIVMLTDGRANVARNGAGGRETAQTEASCAAAAVRAAKIAALFIDTSARPTAAARELAQMMGAPYIPLPFVNARAVSDIVKAVTTTAARQPVVAR